MPNGVEVFVLSLGISCLSGLRVGLLIMLGVYLLGIYVDGICRLVYQVHPDREGI